MQEIGVNAELKIRESQWLHSRWRGFAGFALFHRRLLREADGIHVRSPELSAALVRYNVCHNLEIHETGKLEQRGLLPLVIAAQRRGIIQNLFPINGAAREMLLAAGADPKAVHVSPSGFDETAFAQIPDYRPDRGSATSIVHLGLISRDRGLEVFCAAARCGCSVTLVGECSDAVPSLPNLRHLPPVPMREVPQWYGAADLVLLPYQEDLPTAASMSPIKLFEAMAAGRPIIASDTIAIREILRHEENALLVTAGDHGAWQKAIERLQREPALAVRLAQTARRQAGRYSWRQRAAGIATASGWLAS